MKTRLPKMLLAALLAAMTTAYADLPGYVSIEQGCQLYESTTYGSPIVISTAEGFGSGVSSDPGSTVSIGYGDASGNVYDGDFTLSGTTFHTPNALFIGGPGWPHTLGTGYSAAEGRLTIDRAQLYVASNILMGTCRDAKSYLDIVNDSYVHAVNMQVSNGGGMALANVGSATSAGFLSLDGNLSIGFNDVTAATDTTHLMNIWDGSRVDVAGTTSVGYDGVDAEGKYFCGATGTLNILAGGELNTASLEAGIGMIDADTKLSSSGDITVSGTLNVTGLEIAPGKLQETIIGINGGNGSLTVYDGGVANLGDANVRLGSTSVSDDNTQAEITVEDGGRLNHGGTMYVGDQGTVSEDSGDPNYGIAQLSILEGANAELHKVEVCGGSTIRVDGTLTVDTLDPTGSPDSIEGVRLYQGAILAGTPDNQGGKLTFTVDPENRHGTDIVIDNFTLTEGTTLKAACDTHLKVGDDSTLTFGDGTLWLTNGIGYIDQGTTGVGTITADGGTGHISLAGNNTLNDLLRTMRSEKKGYTEKVALIDVSDFIDGDGGDYSDFAEGTGTLTLDRSGFEVRFADGEGVTVLNGGDGFRGFYVAKVGYNADSSYPSLDSNQRGMFDLIKQMEESGMPLPEALQEVINQVLDLDGETQAGQIQDALDFLGAVNYSVMMHNQIEGNLSHQRMLRNRSMVGRNLRHGKGCTDLYAAGFYNNQRLKGDRSKGEGYRRNEWGGLIGGDTCINENLRLGADVALGWSNISPSHNMKLKQRSLYWDVYAQLRKGNWRSLTTVGMGIHNFKVERGWDRYAAKKNSVRGLSLNISEEVTYDWKVNEKTTIQPFAAVDLNWNRINAFTDSLADPDLSPLATHVAKQTAFVAEFTVGGRYIRDFACVTDAPDATWYFQLGVAVTAGDVDSDLDCNFVGTPDRHFTVKAAERDRVGLDLGTGITVPVNANWAIYGNAEIILRGDSHNLGVQLGAQYAF